MKISPRFLAPIIKVAYRLWCSSLRITKINSDFLFTSAQHGEYAIVSLWHDEFFALLHVSNKLPVVCIVSQSNDGEHVALLLEALDLKTARGSSSRGGITALIRCAKSMRDDKHHICITVDGPRGPRHKSKSGPIFLANRANSSILPVRIFYKNRFCFSSWDKFQLPLPFSKVTIVMGDPYKVTTGKLTAEQIQKECEILEEKMESLAMYNTEPLIESTWKYKCYALVTKYLQKLSLSKLHAISKVFAVVSWHLLTSRRNLAIKAVQKHLQYSYERATKIAKDSFYHNFASFFEIFYSGRLNRTPESIIFNDSPGLKEMLKDTQPIICATAHIGAWELMEAYGAKLFKDRERIVVVRSPKDKVIARIMANLRTEGGMTVVGHRSASTAALQCLRNNGVVAFLVDHNCSKKEATFLPFLEDIAAVNLGPALLALRAKAAVYPTFLLRTPTGAHSFYVGKPLHTAKLKGSINERAETIAKFYTDAVATCVKENPEQWFWMHNRWKTRP